MTVPATGLFVAPCSREAALWSVKAHHYSRSLPAGRLVRIGAWEDGAFIGCLVFGRGASSEIHSPFQLRQDQIVELCRVALGPHQTPTSRIVSIAVRLLRRQSPGLRLIVSYADPEHGHHGGIYAAMNFLYLGTTHRESLIRLNGKVFHPRTVASRYGTRGIDWLQEHIATDAAHVRTMPKHRYALPLDAAMRAQLAPRVQPYPKALECGRSVDSARAGRRLKLVPPRSSPAGGTTREEAGASPDPAAPILHEAAR